WQSANVRARKQARQELGSACNRSLSPRAADNPTTPPWIKNFPCVSHRVILWCRGPDDPGREGETADDPTHDLNRNADRKCPSIGYVRAVDRRSGPAQLGISYSDGLRQLLTQHLEIQSVRKFKCLLDFEGLRGCSRYDYHLHPGGTKASC